MGTAKGHIRLMRELGVLEDWFLDGTLITSSTVDAQRHITTANCELATSKQKTTMDGAKAEVIARLHRLPEGSSHYSCASKTYVSCGQSNEEILVRCRIE